MYVLLMHVTICTVIEEIAMNWQMNVTVLDFNVQKFSESALNKIIFGVWVVELQT